MKNTKIMAVGIILGLGVSVASAQSLGDYAKTVRKNKPDTNSSVKHFDNDNLPVNDSLSVVGPPPTDAKASDTMKPANDTAAANADKQKVADDTAKQIEDQKKKIESLNHDLDLDQREYRLRAAEIYGDAGNRLRNQAEWDKEDKQYRTDIDEKQKAIATANQQLEQIQEQARKSGIVAKNSTPRDHDNSDDSNKENKSDNDHR